MAAPKQNFISVISILLQDIICLESTLTPFTYTAKKKHVEWDVNELTWCKIYRQIRSTVTISAA